MLIFVKLNKELTTCYIVSPSDTIGAIKELIYKETLINPHYQRLTYHDNSEDLDDNKTLSDYNIQDSSILLVFDDVNRMLEFFKACISKTTNASQFLVLTEYLTKLTNMVKDNIFFYDLSKIFELLEMFYQFQEHIQFELTSFSKIKLLELIKSTFELMYEFYKICGLTKNENVADIGAIKT